MVVAHREQNIHPEHSWNLGTRATDWLIYFGAKYIIVGEKIISLFP